MLLVSTVYIAIIKACPRPAQLYFTQSAYDILYQNKSVITTPRPSKISTEFQKNPKEFQKNSLRILQKFPRFWKFPIP